MKNIFMLAAALIAGSALAAAPAGTKLAEEANAASTQFTLTARSTVSYGTSTDWTEKTLEPGAYVCHPSVFGMPSAMSLPRKQCKLTFKGGGVFVAPPVAVTDVVITGQSGTIALTTATAVKYGGGGKFVQKLLQPGIHFCTDVYFGDPAPGVPKACYIAPAGDPAPQSAVRTGTTVTAPVVTPPVVIPPVVTAPTPTPTPTPTPATDAAWLALAENMHTLQGLEYRFGKKSAKTQNRPTLQEPEHKLMPLGDIRGYEFGTFNTKEAGDYASNVLHTMFLPTDPKKYFSVSDLQGSVSVSDVIGTKPEFSWVRYIQNDGDERYNGMELRRMRDSQGVKFENPVCIAQAHGRPGWQTMSLNFFADGRYGTLGANTMTNKTHGTLPSHLKPVACAISSSNEFASVLVWNTQTKQSDVAILSLVGLGDGRTVANPDFPGDANDEGWWGERQEPQPGMNNLGNIAFAKFLGSFPTGLKSATTISFTTGHPRFGYLNGSGAPIGLDGTTGNTAKWKANEQNRQDWATGKFSNRYARQGLIMVGSKDEATAVLIDASPLFKYINKMYFGDRATFMKTTDVGQGADQWPYGFAKAPEQIPKIAKVIKTDSPVTSVFLTPISNKVEYYAIYGTAKGEAHVITLGDFPKTVDPAKWVETDKKFIGENLTWITQIREKANGLQTDLVADVLQQYLFTSREENAVTWADINGGKMTLRRTMQDSRIQDAVVAEDYDNHGTEQYLIAVADFEGQTVHNVLWGPMIMHTYPAKPRFDMRPAGAKFMYGGGMKLPGKPFGISVANIS